MVSNPFVAADVGNARIKLGLFDPSVAEPSRTLSLLGESPEFNRVSAWLADVEEKNLSWPIASVNRPTATALIEWLRANRPEDRVTLLAAGDLPLEVRLPRPDMVGVDRLVDAVAVNRLRSPGRPAAIVDVGSAITVDLVSAEGVFMGGAILPGVEMSARALHKFTDLLPLVDTSDLGQPPPPLGTDTVGAIQAGLYWGAVGAIGRLVEQFQKFAESNDRLQVFITGGAGAAVADLLDPKACYVPNLTLIGIALAAQRT